eukprot:301284-Prymnesium_polylepis.1
MRAPGFSQPSGRMGAHLSPRLAAPPVCDYGKRTWDNGYQGTRVQDSVHLHLEHLPVCSVKRPVDFGSRLRADENDSDKKLYGSLDQRDERSAMA